MHNELAGILREDQYGYHFRYQEEYLQRKKPEPVSLSLPLQEEEFHSQILFPFFDGLIPEGWLLHIAERSWKINPRNKNELTAGSLQRLHRRCKR